MNALSPRELEKKAQTAYQTKDYKLALETYAAAREAYNNSGDLLKSAEMANNLCVVYLQDKQPHRALAEVTGTPALFLEHDQKKLAAFAYGNTASALEATGRLTEAERAYKSALELFTETGEDEALQQTAQSLSQMLLKQGRSFEAIFSMQSGIEGKKKLTLKDRILQKLFKLPGHFLKG
jgi:tetratricopeptide (TPR) repeat protein